MLYKVTLKPGPVRIAASMALAGFSRSVLYPDVTDACGQLWLRPSALLLAVAVCGGETSGQAWVFHGNHDEFGSVDYGLMQVNDHWSPEFFGPVTDAWALNWAKYADNAAMAFKIWSAARAARVQHGGKPGEDFAPWKAYQLGLHLRERYAGRSWMHWAYHGVQGVAAGLAAGETLESLASIDLDPLEY